MYNVYIVTWNTFNTFSIYTFCHHHIKSSSSAVSTPIIYQTCLSAGHLLSSLHPPVWSVVVVVVPPPVVEVVVPSAVVEVVVPPPVVVVLPPPTHLLFIHCLPSSHWPSVPQFPEGVVVVVVGGLGFISHIPHNSAQVYVHLQQSLLNSSWSHIQMILTI